MLKVKVDAEIFRSARPGDVFWVSVNTKDMDEEYTVVLIEEIEKRFHEDLPEGANLWVTSSDLISEIDRKDLAALFDLRNLIDSFIEQKQRQFPQADG